MKTKVYLNNLFFVVFLLLLISCKGKGTDNNSGEYNYYQTQLPIFKTNAIIKYYYHTELGKEIATRLDSFDLSLNPFNKKSIIYKVNNNIDVELDDWFINCFNKAQEISSQTDGMYDITSAPFINLWGFGFQKMDKVTPVLIDSMKSFVGYEKVRIEGRKIVKDDPRVQLNASSIAKGYSCDVVADLLEEYGIENYMIEIGGEIRAKGKNPVGQYWTIGITTPIDDTSGSIEETHETVSLNDRSLATSGNYRNFYVRDGRKYAHTINPKTGYPIETNLLSASVFYPDCMTADGYATAFMAVGLEKAMEIANRIPQMDYLFIYADKDGNLNEVRSAGFNEFQTAE